MVLFKFELKNPWNFVLYRITISDSKKDNVVCQSFFEKYEDYYDKSEMILDEGIYSISDDKVIDLMNNNPMLFITKEIHSPKKSDDRYVYSYYINNKNKSNSIIGYNIHEYDQFDYPENVRSIDDFFKKLINIINGNNASTEKKRSSWTDEEMILTLYIYLTHNPEELHKSSKFLIDFCERLNRFTGNERTPSSIEMRISNYKSVDPNYKKVGLANGGKSVEEFWNRYHDKMNYMDSLYKKFVDNTLIDITDEAVEELEQIEKEYINENVSDKDSYIESTINIRNGSIQRVFRDNLIIEFNQKCAICGINQKNLLISSHILPYSMCDDKKDMINHNNGLLLCPNHDAIFDKKLISFDDKGKIIISPEIESEIYDDLNISKDTILDKKYLNEERLAFMKNHRNMMK